MIITIKESEERISAWVGKWAYDAEKLRVRVQYLL